MDKVWIVVGDEKHEGLGVTTVHASHESALKSLGGYVVRWKKAEGRDYWENGCDVVAIEEHEVQP